jgi:hypothetical protein
MQIADTAQNQALHHQALLITVLNNYVGQYVCQPKFVFWTLAGSMLRGEPLGCGQRDKNTGL